MFLQPVVASIIQRVLQGYFIREMKPKQKTIIKGLLLGKHLLAPSINVLYVIKGKIKSLRKCNLQYVDAVQKHTTKNVCLGTS